jgi:hypothetical protein
MLLKLRDVVLYGCASLALDVSKESSRWMESSRHGRPTLLRRLHDNSMVFESGKRVWCDGLVRAGLRLVAIGLALRKGGRGGGSRSGSREVVEGTRGMGNGKQH